MRQKGLNSVYLGSEKEILDALSRLLENRRSFNIRAIDITREAGLAKSSFYIHYSSVKNLIEVNEKKILNAVEKVINSQGFEKMTIESRWRNILLALYRYHEFLDITIKAGNTNLMHKILNMTKDITIFPQNARILNDELIKVTNQCIISVLERWQKDNFSIDSIPIHAHSIACISASAPRFFWQIFG